MRRFQNSLRTRERVRRCAVGAAFFGCAMAAHASDLALAPLGLTEVAELAVQQQPLLTGLDAQARAAREGPCRPRSCPIRNYSAACAICRSSRTRRIR